MAVPQSRQRVAKRELYLTRLLLLAATAAAVVACSSGPPDNPDAAYGIPHNIVAPSLLRPDGLMINGLLPPQPYSSS